MDTASVLPSTTAARAVTLPARRGGLDRIADEVRQHLRQAVGVRLRGGQVVGDLASELDARGLRLHGELLEDLDDELTDVARTRGDGDAASVDRGGVEQVRDELHHAPRGALDELEL